MHLIKVAAAVLNQTPLAWNENKANIRAAIAEAKRQNVSVLCLPELCISGYGCEDAFHSPGVWRTSWDVLQDLLPDTAGLIVCFGMPVFHQDSVYNAACLVADGRIAGFVAKRFLAGDGIHYEQRWFKAWPSGVSSGLTWNGDRYPLGDLDFRCVDRDGRSVTLGFEICEDAWVADRPGSRMALSGVDVILNPSASHFAFGKTDIRRRFVLEGSRAFGVSYVYANLLGNESGRAIYDGGAMIASSGQLLAVGPRFTFDDVLLTTAVVDVDLTRMNHARVVSFTPDVAPQPGRCVEAEFEFPEVGDDSIAQAATAQFDPAVVHAGRDSWETGERVKEEEFTRAVTLALFDYMRKSRSRGFVVSLSGGADSSATACLVALMVHRAIGQLGEERFREELDYLPANVSSKPHEGSDPIKSHIHQLLTTAYQATANSGDVTRNAARTLAEALGAKHMEFDVEAIVRQYVSTVGDALGRELTWDTDDVALQNIQARVRAPSVWMIANVTGALLLSTSNRSEAAVGYATMDGDTCGGLSPIAGIDKAFLRRWLSWLETTGPEGLFALPELSVVTSQEPTAELRPRSAHQTDEDDLMPYPLLDAIERAAIRDKQTPWEAYRWMRAEFPAYKPHQLAAWVERFYRLWCRNQWKRERYAPSFHLDDKNLDPKTWCRFPILSGGFEHELAELRKNVAREVSS